MKISNSDQKDQESFEEREEFCEKASSELTDLISKERFTYKENFNYFLTLVADLSPELIIVLLYDQLLCYESKIRRPIANEQDYDNFTEEVFQSFKNADQLQALLTEFLMNSTETKQITRQQIEYLICEMSELEDTN